MTSRRRLIETVGVYDADGGWRGEVSYVVGSLLGRVHCSLCDITHSPVRRKRAWDDMVSRLDHPMRVVHRNETTPAEAEVVARTGLPAVLAVWSDAADAAHAADPAGPPRVEPLLGPADLDRIAGSVPDFEAALRTALAAAV